MSNLNNTQLKSAADEKDMPNTTLGQTKNSSDNIKEEDDFLKGTCPYNGSTDSCESCS